MTRSLLQINSGTNYAITIKSFSAPTSPQDNIITGNIYKTEYLHIAQDVKNYMTNSGKTPDFAYQTSLGTQLGYQNLVYMYSMILDYHRTSGKMADFAMMKPWSAVKSSVSPILGNPNIAPTLLTTAPVGKTFTITQVKEASSNLKTYIETNHKLPSYIQLSTYKVATNQFLEMLTSALLQIKLGTNNPIPVKAFSAPANPQDNIVAGNIYKTEYLKIAQDVKNYMDSSGKTPDFAYQTSLGTHLGYQNLVYMFSKILNYQRVNGVLPDFAAMKPWSSIAKTILTQARTVYLTSDYINGYTTDMSRLNTIANALRSMGLTVINYGIGPNTHCSVLQASGVPANALIVDIYGGADAGVIWEMGTNYYKQLVGTKKVFCVWMPPAVDITGLTWLTRAHDDCYSSSSFTGLAHPDQYLHNNGYDYIYSGNLNNIISAIYNQAIT